MGRRTAGASLGCAGGETLVRAFGVGAHHFDVAGADACGWWSSAGGNCGLKGDEVSDPNRQALRSVGFRVPVVGLEQLDRNGPL